jgi:hypothetical protein
LSGPSVGKTVFLKQAKKLSIMTTLLITHLLVWDLILDMNRILGLTAFLDPSLHQDEVLSIQQKYLNQLFLK